VPREFPREKELKEQTQQAIVEIVGKVSNQIKQQIPSSRKGIALPLNNEMRRLMIQ